MHKNCFPCKIIHMIVGDLRDCITKPAHGKKGQRQKQLLLPAFLLLHKEREKSGKNAEPINIKHTAHSRRQKDRINRQRIDGSRDARRPLFLHVWLCEQIKAASLTQQARSLRDLLHDAVRHVDHRHANPFPLVAHSADSFLQSQDNSALPSAPAPFPARSSQRHIF